MSRSVIEAIKDGIWDFEPQNKAEEEYIATDALPGSVAKLDVLALRLQAGLPLWHPEDRHSYDDGVSEEMPGRKA